jgi:Spy/CpxP family protein refolding chaperone
LKIKKEYTMLKQSRFLAITAAALALSIGAVNAASAAAPDAQPPAGPGMMGGPGGHDGHRMEMRMKKALDKLHGQLNLNADQEKLWQSALDTMKQNHAAMRQSHEQMRAQMQSVKQQPILDLNAMYAAHQKIEQQNAQLRDQTSAAWLNFYNALNDQQKTTVSTALKQRFAKMEEHREHWGQHRGMPAGASAANP